jgi:hypothetical protein
VIPLKLWYSTEQTEGDVVHTHDDLDPALDRVAALAGPNWPALAEVTRFDNRLGPLLYVGLHVERGALPYSGDDDEKGSYTAGRGSREGDPLLYMQGTSACEFPPNCEVSTELVRRAVHEFADTGRRPTCVEWQVWVREPGDSGSEWPAL